MSEHNEGLNPYQVMGMFGEHVSVRLETVTVTRNDGAVPPRKLPVLVLEIEQPVGPTVKVTFEAEGAAEFGGLYSEQLRRVAEADGAYWAVVPPEHE